MLTPISSASFQNMELNAGMFIVGFDHTEYNTVATLKAALKTLIESHDTKLIGATRGGGTFAVTKGTREIEADGKRASYVGSTIVDGVDASITGTALEFTAENLKRIMSCADTTDTEDGKKHVVKMRNFIKNEDYLDKLCWVGDKSDGGFILIAFDNALNRGDVNITFTDKGEATLPFEFHAYQSDVIADEYAPFEIVLLDA